MKTIIWLTLLAAAVGLQLKLRASSPNDGVIAVPAAAAPQLTLEKQLWLLRELGFFAQHAALSDAELEVKLKTDYASEYQEQFKPGDADSTLRLLGLDKSRTWWQDMEGGFFCPDIYTSYAPFRFVGV